MNMQTPGFLIQSLLLTILKNIKNFANYCLLVKAVWTYVCVLYSISMYYSCVELKENKHTNIMEI